jgi:hypothetical protein
LGRTCTGWIAPACGWRTHSITSSARASSVGDKIPPPTVTNIAESDFRYTQLLISRMVVVHGAQDAPTETSRIILQLIVNVRAYPYNLAVVPNDGARSGAFTGPKARRQSDG